MTQCNAVQHQPLASNLNLAVAAPSSHYNPYVAAPCGIRDFPAPVNYGCMICCHSQALTELLVFLQRTTEESFLMRMELEDHLREKILKVLLEITIIIML